MENIDLDKKRNIIEISNVIQGEGKRSGRPALLVRVTGCPLRCQWGDNTCDSYYTSWNPEKGSFTLGDLVARFNETEQIKDIIITGGEPLQSESLLDEMIRLAHAYGKHVTIETAGIKDSTIALQADLISISPKMGNSTPQLGHSVDGGRAITQADIDRHEKTRKNYDAVKFLTEGAADYQLKFVTTSDESVAEVDGYMKKVGLTKEHVYLMPEGVLKVEIDSRRRWLIEKCIETGYNYTDRLHILAYNDMRNV